jgi:hypothetical protein
MALVVSLSVEPAGQPAGRIVITRLDWMDLSDKDAIADRVNAYEVMVDGKAVGKVEHRYGDGAWVLVRKALDLAILYKT